MPRQKQIPKKLRRKPVTQKRQLKAKAKTVPPINENTKILCKNWLKSLGETPKYDEIGSDDNNEKEVDATDVGPISLRKSLANVSKHQLTHTILFECEWKACKFECREEQPYMAHVAGHAQFNEHPAATTYTCQWDLCKYKSNDVADITRHINYHAYHTKLKTYGASLREIIKIPICKIDSRKRNDIPEQPNSYPCAWDDCTLTFESMQGFLDHVFSHAVLTYKFEDKKVKTVKCLWLGCTATTERANLRGHVDRAHVKEKVIACHNCGTLFTRKKSFIMHCQRQVDDEFRQFQCPECFKSFPTTLLFREHAKQHMTNYRCDLCQMTFAAKAKLALHIRSQHIPVCAFKCATCAKGFKEKRQLEMHLRTHTELKFKCQEIGCTYTSKTKMMLTRHRERKHEAFIRIYKCHTCDQEYRLSTCLTKHLRKVHGLEYPPGHSRFVYRQYEDGFYRLIINKIETYNPSTTKKMQESSSSSVSSEEAKTDESEIENNDQLNVKISYRINTAQPESAKKLLVPDTDKITIVVEDMDEAGNVIREKTLQVNEIFQD